MKRKPGRPANHWLNPETGEPVIGLGRRPNGRFYAIGTNKTFGTDPDIALRRFYAWKEGNTGPPAPKMMTWGSLRLHRLSAIQHAIAYGMEEPYDDDGEVRDVKAEINRARKDALDEYDSVPDHIKPFFTHIIDSPPQATYFLFRFYMVEMGFDREVREHDVRWGQPDDVVLANADAAVGVERPLTQDAKKFAVGAGFLYHKHYNQHWAAFHDWLVGRWIKRNPEEAAKRLGMPELANLQAIKPPPPSWKLSELADRYENRPTGHKGYLKDTARLFREFAKIAGVGRVREIEPEHMNKYADHILRACEENDHARFWIKSRFDAVQRVLRFARKRGRDMDALTRAIGLCAMLEIPRYVNKSERGVNPISREHLHALLKHATTKQTAVILLGLNAAYGTKDIATVPRAAVDLDAGILHFGRAKRGVGKYTPRVAVLWGRTVDAIRRCLDEKPHQAKNQRGVLGLFSNDSRTVPNQPIANGQNWIAHWWRPLCETAGVPGDVYFKDLRKGNFTEAYQINDRQAHILAGHRLPGVDDNYLKRNPRMVAPACRAIEKHYFA